MSGLYFGCRGVVAAVLAYLYHHCHYDGDCERGEREVGDERLRERVVHEYLGSDLIPIRHRGYLFICYLACMHTHIHGLRVLILWLWSFLVYGYVSGFHVWKGGENRDWG